MPSNKPYQHKNIIFDSSVNTYLLKNNESFNRLKQIYDQKIPYVSDDYHVLILCFERLYKGVYKELQEMGAPIAYISDNELRYGIKNNKGEHKHPHFFRVYASNINRIIPLADNTENYCNILSTITEKFQPIYTPSRFEENIPFEEFQKDFRRFETQTYRLYKGLEECKEKYKKPTIEEIDDYDDWS